MIDVLFVRNNPDVLDRALRNRNKEPLEGKLLELDERSRFLQTELQRLQKERNDISQSFGLAKSNGEDLTDLSSRMDVLKKRLTEISENASVAKDEYLEFLSAIPNIPSDECPIGVDENDNVEVRRFGVPRNFDFEPLEHYEIGSRLGMMDFEKASNIAGSRFVFLFSKLARLERSLAQFMLDVHTKEHGYTEVYVPLILEQKAMFGVGQLPKFEEDLFKTTVGSYLIPTAEASLANIFNGETLSEEALPLRYTAYTPCFRSEAGSAGRDTAGMLRQHQFGKVELVSITTPEQSIEEHERMTECSENILKQLKLPFRTVVLSTGDMGFCSQKTYDIEVWLPGQNRYREISSCSRCGDFQARRMSTRFKNKSTKKNEFVHTLNGSGVAVGRCLIAVLENYQRSDGSVEIPEALVKYFCGEYIGKSAS
ncbi:MAG: serine--tRNA ligase [Holosporales bacterium]|jgi:seryl-tRNA synthetase|nr:serine--tRNA ligase [Holosporales bacterium]